MQEIKKGWKKVKLGDILEMKYGKMPDKNLFKKGGYPIFSGYNIVGHYEKYLFEDSCLLVVARGVGGTGDVKISPKKSWITNLSIVLFNFRGLDKIFGYYLLGNENLRKLDSGSAQSQITIGDLSLYEILLPPLPTQQKIVSILSKYDDLIENNNKRIKILEETAQSIYEEWFVKYNFPGNENIKMIESGNDDFGMIPEGWEVKKVGELLEKITRKQKIKTTEYLENGSFPIIDQGREFIAGFTNDEKLVEKDLLPIVIFGDHTRILKYVDFPFVCGADGTQLLFPKNQKLLPVYFYMAIKNIDLGNFHYARHFKFLKEEYIIIPGDEILEKFNNNLKDNFKLSEELRKQNQNLKETRDVLIPRLVSGELDVESLDVK